jgi:hypothetical protein
MKHAKIGLTSTHQVRKALLRSFCASTVVKSMPRRMNTPLGQNTNGIDIHVALPSMQQHGYGR